MLEFLRLSPNPESLEDVKTEVEEAMDEYLLCTLGSDMTFIDLLADLYSTS